MSIMSFTDDEFDIQSVLLFIFSLSFFLLYNVNSFFNIFAPHRVLKFTKINILLVYK
jgi:hypothetical protein